MQSRLRLVGDGSARGTRLELDGMMVPSVAAITLTIDARDRTANATVEIHNIGVDIGVDEDAVTVLQHAIAAGERERATGISA